MPIFKLSAPKNNASVEWSYFAQQCIKFHLQSSRFDKNFRGETPGLPTSAGKGRGEGKMRGRIKEFVLLKEWREGKAGEGREGGREKGGRHSVGGILLQGLKGG